MGTLIAVEGLDGAGKNTLVRSLINYWIEIGCSTSTFTFPQYGNSLTADLANEALHGDHGDLRSSAYAMALLFALDRREAREALIDAVNNHDFVLLDRYVASNAAYSAARLGEDIQGEAVTWVTELEFNRFQLPKPDIHLLLAISPDIAQARAKSRADLDNSRARDFYEKDTDLQTRTAVAYQQLAHKNWQSPWLTTTTNDNPKELHQLISTLL